VGQFSVAGVGQFYIAVNNLADIPTCSQTDGLLLSLVTLSNGRSFADVSMSVRVDTAAKPPNLGPSPTTSAIFNCMRRAKVGYIEPC